MRNRISRIYRNIIADMIEEEPVVVDETDALLKNKDWEGLRDLIAQNKIVDFNIVNNIIDIMMMKYRIEPLIYLIVNGKIKDFVKINKIVDLAIEAGEWEPLFNLLKYNKLSDAERIRQIIEGMYYNDMEQYLKTLKNSMRYKEIIERVESESEVLEDDLNEDTEDESNKSKEEISEVKEK